MDRIRIYLETELAKFIREQRIKAGFQGTSRVRGYTFDELEKRASRIGCSELYGIFEECFDECDTRRFWFDLQIGLYNEKRVS